jgi:hypothetical protein
MECSLRGACRIIRAKVPSIAKGNADNITIEGLRESRRILQFLAKLVYKYSQLRLKNMATSPSREFAPYTQSTSGRTFQDPNVINYEGRLWQQHHRPSLRTQSFVTHFDTIDSPIPWIIDAVQGKAHHSRLMLPTGSDTASQWNLATLG